MEVVAKKLKLDKSEWKLTKLGDIAKEYSKRVDNPSLSEYDRFVGLEHFVSGDIKIKNWGSTENLGSSMKTFHAGDILFARRNAYLRRASMVDFDGCCSGDAFVIREDHEKVVPGYLAFVMNSDALWDYANTNAAGTMSKRVKWRDLAEYEFLLPPKAQQKQLSELLWAMDDVIENDIDLYRKADVQYEVAKSNLVLRGINIEVEYSKAIKKDVAKNWKTTTIGSLLEEGFLLSIQDGNHGEIHPKSSDYIEDGIPFIMANTLGNGQIDFANSKKLPKELTDKLRIGFSLSGDVLLSHKGTVGQVAIVPENIEWPYLMLTPQVTYYRANKEKLSNKFLYYVFTSNYFHNQIERLSSQSTRAYVGITSQRLLKLVIPRDLSEQNEITDVLETIEQNRYKIESKIAGSKALQKSLINQIF